MTLKRINTSDKNLQLIQDFTDAALIPLQQQSLSGGVMLKNISLIAAQDNLIEHTLGRMPQLVLALVPNANSTIWSPLSATLGNQSSNTQYVNLRCSASCTLNVWVN